MALFKKRDETKLKDFSKLPELPQLPELPEIPENEYSDDDIEEFSGKIPQLPRFPNDSLGQKFSQNTIKEAITGKKDNKVFADDIKLQGFQIAYDCFKLSIKIFIHIKSFKSVFFCLFLEISRVFRNHFCNFSIRRFILSFSDNPVIGSG